MGSRSRWGYCAVYLCINQLSAGCGKSEATKGLIPFQGTGPNMRRLQKCGLANFWISKSLQVPHLQQAIFRTSPQQKIVIQKAPGGLGLCKA